jgi:hypothetical protein
VVDFNADTYFAVSKSSCLQQPLKSLTDIFARFCPLPLSLSSPWRGIRGVSAFMASSLLGSLHTSRGSAWRTVPAAYIRNRCKLVEPGRTRTQLVLLGDLSYLGDLAYVGYLGSECPHPL